MLKSIVFWIGLAGVLVSWELVFFDTQHVLYWLFLCLAGSGIASMRLSEEGDSATGVFVDRVACVLFCVGAFWWFLWLDFAYFKYAAPVAVWLVMVHALRRSSSALHISSAVRLMLFFGGTFFWSVTSFGLLSVIGWQLWQTLALFMASFSVLAYAGVRTLRSPGSGTARAWLVLFLLGIELFSVVA
ncbi:MAG: hypothetical protein U1C18_01155, partial [Patescibacteria group bacterium]|nr:hypothetical protein [Patescibacteria group bacterium]